MATHSLTKAIRAITALIDGRFDDPALSSMGPIPIDPMEMVKHILEWTWTDEATLARADAAITAVASVSTVQLVALQPHAIADGLALARAMYRAPCLQGFNASSGADDEDEDQEVNGGDAVELLGELWAKVRSAAGADAGASHASVPAS